MSELTEALDGRHPATRDVAAFFSFDHLPEGRPRDASEVCTATAVYMLGTVEDCPELTAGLRKLLEAKDCFVRATLTNGRPS